MRILILLITTFATFNSYSQEPYKTYINDSDTTLLKNGEGIIKMFLVNKFGSKVKDHIFSLKNHVEALVVVEFSSTFKFGTKSAEIASHRVPIQIKLVIDIKPGKFRLQIFDPTFLGNFSQMGDYVNLKKNNSPQYHYINYFKDMKIIPEKTKQELAQLYYDNYFLVFYQFDVELDQLNQLLVEKFKYRKNDDW